MIKEIKKKTVEITKMVIQIKKTNRKVILHHLKEELRVLKKAISYQDLTENLETLDSNILKHCRM